MPNDTCMSNKQKNVERLHTARVLIPSQREFFRFHSIFGDDSQKDSITCVNVTFCGGYKHILHEVDGFFLRQRHVFNTFLILESNLQWKRFFVQQVKTIAKKKSDNPKSWKNNDVPRTLVTSLHRCSQIPGWNQPQFSVVSLLSVPLPKLRCKQFLSNLRVHWN